MFHPEAGCRCENGFEHDIQSRGDATKERIRETPQHCRLAVTQKFVEDQRLATRTQHSGDLAEAPCGVGNHRQDQVQYRDIENARGKRQVLCVSLDRREIDLTGTRYSAAQHGVG